jgi:RNA 2',3'-cyclic 3'-phosphodiesterase
VTESVARVFFALVPPVPLRRSLGDVARALARRVGGRPVPGDNIHLTLAFIGAWPLARLPGLLDIGSRLDGVAIPLTLDRIGGFRKAGVAWIGASTESKPLQALAVSLNRALSREGVAVDQRPFHPHVTLVRKARGPFPEEAAGPCEWEIDAVTLMRSDTHAEGARYDVLASWPLADARITRDRG